MGYYEVKDTQGSELLEAPTLILEVGLTPDKEIQDSSKIEELIYSKSGEKSLFENLTITLRNRLRKYGIQEPQIGIDNDGDEPLQVLFYPLTNMRGCNIRNVKIEAGDTAEGNNRIPEDKIKIDGFVGPMPPVYEERYYE